MAGTSTDGVPDLTAEIAAGEEDPLPPPAVNEEDVYDPSDIYGLNRNAASGRAVSGRAENRRVVPSNPASGEDDADAAEVIRISIPSPKLTIPVDGKPDPRTASDNTRAFVRDVKKYFALVKGGNVDEVRCLFLSNALAGRAKTWHDEWTLARGSYSSDELLAALLVRFAPQIQSRATSARNKLASGAYVMRKSETVCAYQNRFDALLTSIPDCTENDRIFWFHRGLSESLSKRCATDHLGRNFLSYNALVVHALGKETKDYTQKHSSSAAVRFNFLRAQGTPSEDDSDEAPEPPTKRSRPRSEAPVAAVAASERPAAKKLSTGPTAMTKFGCTYAVMQDRKAARQCLVCGKDGHQVAGCPDWPLKAKAAQRHGGGKKLKRA